MGNQQERLVSLEYVAGLVCGEGCFGFHISRQKNNRGTINPLFQLFMIDQETIDVLYRSIRFHDLPCYYDSIRRKKGEFYRDQYGVRIHGVKRLKAFTDAMVPLLTGNKLQAAQIVNEFCTRRLSLPAKAGYGPADIEFVRRSRETNGNRRMTRISLEELPRILRDYMSDMG